MTPQHRKERRERILATYAELGTIRGTARKLGHSINTIRRVLRGQDEPRLACGRTKRPSKLDPYRPLIRRLVLEERLSAVLILEELRTLGYEGGASILKSYVRQLRPRAKVRVTTRLEHPPGEEGQVDWSPYSVALAGERTVVQAFCMVLPFSRFVVVRFALDQQLPTLLALHQEAFSLIGAIPRRMTYDNMTTVGRHVGPGEVKLNPHFEAYALAHGFCVHILPPGRPRLHGCVERPFQYIENNCLARARFRFDSLAQLNAHAAWWCEEVANVRVHGTTRERPVDRLERERPLMLPLGFVPPEPHQSLARLVRNDYSVAVQTNHYSVPPNCVGQPATVKLFAERLEILVGGQTIAVHRRCHGRHQRLVLPEHEEAFAQVSPSRLLLEQAFVRLGPGARDYYEGLRAQRGRGAGYHLQRILKLARRYGPSVVTAAMAHTARYGSFSASAVARVITGPKSSPLSGSKLQSPGAEPPPERVRRWLEGLDVEQRDLSDYDRMLKAFDETRVPDPAPAHLTMEDSDENEERSASDDPR